MNVLKRIKTTEDLEDYRFRCPGCGNSHWIRAKGPTPCWTFNGDLVKPTFAPSLLVNGSHPPSRCHSFIRNGMIEFLMDCFHELKGKTVPLPGIENEEERK